MSQSTLPLNICEISHLKCRCRKNELGPASGHLLVCCRRTCDLFYLMRRPFYRPYAWNRTALEQMKGSSALRQTKNQKLAAAIAAYEALTHHLDDDFDFHRAVGATAISLARQVVDMNYPGLGEVVPVNEYEVFSFPHSNIHAAYAGVNLSLLTDDVQSVAAAVNGYLILADKLGIA